MAVTDGEIHGTVRAYLRDYPAETKRLRPLLAALREPKPTPMYSRALADPGHVTASALLLNQNGEVLYLLDDKRKRWIVPGGHVEVDDPSLPDAARRELFEETGIPPEQVYPLHGMLGRALDIGLRKSSGSRRRGEPKHLHFDIRFPMVTDADVKHLMQKQASCYRWMPTAAAPPSRVATKLSALLS